MRTMCTEDTKCAEGGAAKVCILAGGWRHQTATFCGPVCQFPPLTRSQIDLVNRPFRPLHLLVCRSVPALHARWVSTPPPARRSGVDRRITTRPTLMHTEGWMHTPISTVCRDAPSVLQCVGARSGPDVPPRWIPLPLWTPLPLQLLSRAFLHQNNITPLHPPAPHARVALPP